MSLVTAAKGRIGKAVPAYRESILERLGHMPGEVIADWESLVASGVKHGKSIGLWVNTYQNLEVNMSRFTEFVSHAEKHNPLFMMMARSGAKRHRGAILS